MPSRLSAPARRFLADDVHSVMQLELVLLLHRDRDAAWTAMGLARELRTAEPWVAGELVDLVALGAARATDGAVPTYRAEAGGPLTPAIEEVAALYPTLRTTIITLIFQSSPDDR